MSVFARLLARFRTALGFLALGLFLVAEAHAFGVLRPFDNVDHAWIFSGESLVPLQFRLLAYHLGAGDFRSLEVLLPLAFLTSLGGYALAAWGARKLRLPADNA